MAIGPIALALLWIVQYFQFGLTDQWDGLKKSIPSLFVLVLAVKTIALPWVQGHDFSEVHDDSDSQWQSLKVKRPIKQFNPTDTSGGNASFGLAFINALWQCKLGDDTDLQTLCPS